MKIKRKWTRADKARAMRQVWRQDPQRRKRQSQFFLKLWQDPTYRARVVKSQTGLKRSATTRRRIGQALKRLWQQASYRRRMVAIYTQRWRDPTVRRRHSAAIRSLWRTEDYRRCQLRSQRVVWADPRHRRKMAAASRRRWRDPVNRAKWLAIARRNIGPSRGARCLHRLLGAGWQLEYWTPHGPLDVAHPKRKVAIEVDGPEHLRPQQRQRDRRKEAALRRLGWRILRMSEEDCRAIRGGGL